MPAGKRWSNKPKNKANETTLSLDHKGNDLMVSS